MIAKILTARLIWLALALIGGLSSAGCMDSLINGECAAGKVSCGGVCVDLQNDPDNCGACGSVCTGTCGAGVCEAPIDDGPDGGDGEDGDGGRGRDAGHGDGDGGTSTGDDGGTSTGDDGGTGTGDDGGTGTGDIDAGTGTGDIDAGTGTGDIDAGTGTGDIDAGTGTGDIDAGTAPDAEEPLACELPEMACDGVCIDTSNDPDNCGGCDIVCPSGLCADSHCVGEINGHVVLIGHDFATPRVGANRVVGNAVFLPLGREIKVTSYQGTASPSALAGTRAAINQVASQTGRTWIETAAGADLAAALTTANVFVVYAQSSGTVAELTALGATWKPTLETFIARGGVVVVLDGSAAATYPILVGAGLTTVNGRREVTGEQLSVVAPSNAVAIGVPSPYRAPSRTVAFTGATDSVAVVADALGDPVVLHRAY